MANTNYMFYVFIILLIITILIWLWAVFYNKKSPTEQIIYEYTEEEIPIENSAEEISQIQTNEIVESIKNV